LEAPAPRTTAILAGWTGFAVNSEQAARSVARQNSNTGRRAALKQRSIREFNFIRPFCFPFIDGKFSIKRQGPLYFSRRKMAIGC
jgi:hypothetical protein